MELLLQELSSASKLLTDFREMYEYENRLKTFTKWPFQENCKCTPENVSLKMVILPLSYFLCTVPDCEVIVKYIHVHEESTKPEDEKFNTPAFLCSLLRNTMAGLTGFSVFGLPTDFNVVTVLVPLIFLFLSFKN